MEYQSCMDGIFCTESDEWYQLYLMAVGAEDAFTYLCTNDTFSGLSCSLFNCLSLDVMSLPLFDFVVVFVICPIVIEYGMGQIMKPICVCVSVCPPVCTLTVTFFYRFSSINTMMMNIGKSTKIPKSKYESVEV